MSPGLVLPIIPEPIMPPSEPLSDSKISRRKNASPPTVPTAPTAPSPTSAARRDSLAIPEPPTRNDSPRIVASQQQTADVSGDFPAIPVLIDLADRSFSLS